ncbi:hypothetical protein JCM24511_01205 [Saitozyma sp. JCM 24511]|nr:hypothetical protein JCM24511_01205 [Saitozyma sp. JCM 24511]
MWPATLTSSGFDHIFSTLTRHLSTLTGHLPSLRGTRFHLLWLYYTLHHHLRRYMNRPPSPHLQCASIGQLQHTVDCLFWANDHVHRSIGHFWRMVCREGQHAWQGLISDPATGVAKGVGWEGRDGAVVVCVVVVMLCLVWLVWSVWSLQRSRSRTDKRHVHFTTEAEANADADTDEDDPVQLQKRSPSRTPAPLTNRHFYRRLGGYLVPVKTAHWPEYYRQAISDAMAHGDGIIRLERTRVKRDMRDNVIRLKGGVVGVKEQTEAWQCDGIEWR